ncbi:Feruloyl CoA ortho-hydroxylase 2 [Capsicum annuum]|nr:Feruloyl CoA ortho-hydroxylase 2 [Capsicum annuum]
MVYPESESWVEKLMTRGILIGTRKISFTGDHTGVSVPTNLPYSSVKTTWRGKKAVSSGQLQMEGMMLTSGCIGECNGKVIISGTKCYKRLGFGGNSPELTVGAGRHADVLPITTLLQDDVVGLYIQEPKGEGWIHVPPVKGALVINIRDVLRIMSNDRYKSVEHHVIVSASRNRVSVPISVNLAPDAVFGPLKQVLENREKPWHKQVVYSDYFNYFFSKGHEGKQTIEFAKL